MPTLALDTEVYKDYFLLSFLNLETGKIRHFEMYPGRSFDVTSVAKILNKYRVVSFNGRNFDLPLITLALRKKNCAQIKEVADKIIKNNMKWWQLGIEPVECDHIDLIEVAPGFVSLKIYGGRLHCQRLQDLPLAPDASVQPGQQAMMREYCENDLHTTATLFEKLKDQIALREDMGKTYGLDLRSKSDAQIAEAVIKAEVAKRSKHKLPKLDPFRLAGEVFYYDPPDWIDFQDPQLVEMLQTVETTQFKVYSNGVVKMPKELTNLKICIGEGVYRMGIGGLHSTEKSIARFASDDFLLVDRDVASYYPSIILGCGLCPSDMGSHFTSVYKTLVDKRLKAKRAGDTVTADSLKIVINGSFGKFGSPYSALYDPKLLIQTTLTGQLALLMLIEMLESVSVRIVSANTDGVVILCRRDRQDAMVSTIQGWENLTGFVTEETAYKALYSRDVNNYIAIKEDGFKAKGIYAGRSLAKSPQSEICAGSVIKYLLDGTPVEQSIRQCRDITKFVVVRTVKGGAQDQIGLLLGKAVRWYYSTKVEGPLTYCVNGYTVPRSEGAMPALDLPEEFPDDIDYGWYINEAQQMLKDIGCA